MVHCPPSILTSSTRAWKLSLQAAAQDANSSRVKHVFAAKQNVVTNESKSGRYLAMRSSSESSILKEVGGVGREITEIHCSISPCCREEKGLVPGETAIEH